MSESDCGINSAADKRYYHFVAVKGRGAVLSRLWRILSDFGEGEIERPVVAVSLESTRFKLEHKKLRLKKPYAKGAAALTLSEHGRGQPPFLYDLFAARIDFEDAPCLVVGFPFAALALGAIDHLKSNGFMQNVEFLGVEMSELLSEKNRPLKLVHGLSSSVVGVRFVVTDDKSLTAVRLGGDDPFQAQIYESFLKQKFELGLWVPDQCVLACERKEDTTDEGRLKPPGGLIRSRLHVDTWGNFKFYMHAGCANVKLMPYAIAQVHAMGCLKMVNGNPLKRIEKDDGS